MFIGIMIVFVLICAMIFAENFHNEPENNEPDNKQDNKPIPEKVIKFIAREMLDSNALSPMAFDFVGIPLHVMVKQLQLQFNENYVVLIGYKSVRVVRHTGQSVVCGDEADLLERIKFVDPDFIPADDFSVDDIDWEWLIKKYRHYIDIIYCL